MYKMGILPDENIGTITVKDADGNEIQVDVAFEFTDITSTGEVSLGVIPKTGPAAGVSIPLKGNAKKDGSIDVVYGLESGAASGVSISSLRVVDPKVASDIKGLATAVKAKKRADREFRLALEGEALATIETKNLISNVANNVETLSTRLPGNQKIKVASDILNASAASGSDVLEGDTLAEAIGAAQDAADAAPQTAAELAAAGQNAAEDAAEAVTALTASVNRQIAELQKVISTKTKAKARKGAAKKTVVKGKIGLKKAVAKLR